MTIKAVHRSWRRSQTPCERHHIGLADPHRGDAYKTMIARERRLAGDAGKGDMRRSERHHPGCGLHEEGFGGTSLCTSNTPQAGQQLCAIPELIRATTPITQFPVRFSTGELCILLRRRFLMRT
jgi:hypothetical protein